MPKKTPMRMCISCREMKTKKEMLRIVKNANGEIRLDFVGKLPGRGAYICANEDCIKKLSKMKLLNRTFETEVNKEVYDAIMEDFLGREK